MAILQTYHGYPLWLYVPSVPAAIVVCALFSITTLAHCWKMVSTRTWMCIPFVIGGICTCHPFFPPNDSLH